jgi:hypothetical protein
MCGVGGTRGASQPTIVADEEFAASFIKRQSEDGWPSINDTEMYPLKNRKLDSFERLCRKQYWDRLWIIQEITMRVQ